MTQSSAKCRAFTLVEVVLAVGIFAFVIVAILGLTSMSINSDRQSSVDTTLTLMTQTCLVQLHNLGFAEINGTGSMQGKTLYFKAAASRSPDYYFDVGGRLATTPEGKPDTNNHPDSIYSCTVSAVPTSSLSMVMLRLQFRWPVSAPTANQQTRTVYTSMANYD